ncbi:hypothetical protein HA402_007767 [Bradysia odoriphaga]|nr:hypothetical protein HA402_007767 [Bradysia odoriphaga]
MTDDLNSSATVTLIRTNLREHRKIERLHGRNESSDAYRVGVVAIKDIISDLDSITEKDVTGLASRIKRKKGATEEDLNRLSHAFLLNVENIVTFSKITGALNVIVKELTGNDSTKRILACECLCNFSLGNDICCEKLTSAASSYLIMFLESTHQRLAVTAAWTISNILVTEQTKTVDILLSQGLMHKLIGLITLKSSNDELVAEGIKCIFILLSMHQKCLRSEDRTALPSIVVDLFNVSHKYGIQASYHALYTCDFEISEADCTNILEKCTTFLCKFVNSWSTMSSPDNKLCVALVLRIIGNFTALRVDVINVIIGQFAEKGETFPKILGEILKIDSVYRNDIFWIGGNVFKADVSCRDDIVNMLDI